MREDREWKKVSPSNFKLLSLQLYRRVLNFISSARFVTLFPNSIHALYCVNIVLLLKTINREYYYYTTASCLQHVSSSESFTHFGLCQHICFIKVRYSCSDLYAGSNTISHWSWVIILRTPLQFCSCCFTHYNPFFLTPSTSPYRRGIRGIHPIQLIWTKSTRKRVIDALHSKRKSYSRLYFLPV